MKENQIYFTIDNSEITGENVEEFISLSSELWRTSKFYRSQEDFTFADFLEGIFERLWRKVWALDPKFKDGRYWIIKHGL